jgi:hypothetical protein
MATVFISDIQIVGVRTPSTQEGDLGVVTLWYAAVLRYQAVSAVRTKVPANQTVELTDERLSQVQVARMKIRPGEVGALGSR